MEVFPITQRRFERPRPEALAGDARPGDVLTLPGGTLVRDLNENGRIDARDARVGRVDELVGRPVLERLRGGLVDVRG